jgi:ribosomal protein L12E/L44/L45/RPP1/RPP2
VKNISDEQKDARNKFYQERANLKQAVEASTLSNLTMEKQDITTDGYLYGALKRGLSGNEKKAYRILQLMTTANVNVDKVYADASVEIKDKNIIFNNGRKKTRVALGGQTTEQEGGATHPTEQEGGATHPTEQEGGATHPTEQEGGATHPTEQEGGATHPTEQEGGATHPTEQEGGATHPTEQEGGATHPTEQEGGATHPTEQGNSRDKEKNTNVETFVNRNLFEKIKERGMDENNKTRIQNIKWEDSNTFSVQNGVPVVNVNYRDESLMTKKELKDSSLSAQDIVDYLNANKVLLQLKMLPTHLDDTAKNGKKNQKTNYESFAPVFDGRTGYTVGNPYYKGDARLTIYKEGTPVVELGRREHDGKFIAFDVDSTRDKVSRYFWGMISKSKYVREHNEEKNSSKYVGIRKIKEYLDAIDKDFE